MMVKKNLFHFLLKTKSKSLHLLCTDLVQNQNNDYTITELTLLTIKLDTVNEKSTH